MILNKARKIYVFGKIDNIFCVILGNFTGFFPKKKFKVVWTRRRGSARTCSSRCTLLPAVRAARSAYSRFAARSAICSGTRYAKWAGGSRSQTHRRAAMCGFTQDDGYVRGVAPTHKCSSDPSKTSSIFCDF